MKIHVFDVDKLPRRVLDRTWPILAAKSAENDPNLAPQDDPKSTKNRVQKMIKILIDFKTAGTRFLEPTGGMRSPPGGDLGEVQKLRQRRYAVRCRDLLLRSWQVWQLQHLRLGV